MRTIIKWEVAVMGRLLSKVFLVFGSVLVAALPAQADDIEQDRAAILAMVGDFEISFDFRETAALAFGYELAEPYQTGGTEMVRVVEDTGDFISLQHILVVGGPRPMAIKHWRQDWQYEPADVLTFRGGNAWAAEPVSEENRTGAWRQVVYQVDDSPRYGAVAKWTHADGISTWNPEAEWRPLPRRDATKRDDYHAIDAVNRHVITPDGWLHEQHNTKLILDGAPKALAREIGVNSYTRIEGHDMSVGEAYWAATKDYWAGVRAAWTALEQNGAFGINLVGEPEELYQQILGLSMAVEEGEMDSAEAIEEATAIITDITMSPPATLKDRLAGQFAEADY